MDGPPADPGDRLVRTSMQLPPEQVRWLEERARRTQSRSVAHELRLLIAAAMDREAATEREPVAA